MRRPPCQNCGTRADVDLCPECRWRIPLRRRSRIVVLWWRLRGVRVSPYVWPDCGKP